MIRQLATGNIGIGNTSTLAIFNDCFGFTKIEPARLCGLRMRRLEWVFNYEILAV